MKTCIMVLLTSLLFLQCTKDEVTGTESPEIIFPEIRQLPFFTNTNEEWYYKIKSFPGYHTSVLICNFKVLRDTTLDLAGNYFDGAVLSEHRLLYADGSSTPSINDLEYVVFFDKDYNLLKAVKGSKFIILADFNFIQTDSTCGDGTYIVDAGREKVGKYWTRRYINTRNQKMLQGITLAIDKCGFDPPFETLFYHELVEMKYTSDEYQYVWYK